MRLKNLCIIAFTVAAMPIVMASQCKEGAGLTCPTVKTYSDAFLAAVDKEMDLIQGKAPHIMIMLNDYDVTAEAIRNCIKRKKK